MNFCLIQSKDQSTEEIAEAEKTLAEAAARRKSAVVKTPSGVEVNFEIYYANKIKTNGGWMYDILVSKDDKETRCPSYLEQLCIFVHLKRSKFCRVSRWQV